MLKIIYLLFLSFSYGWNIESWKTKPFSQMLKYKNENKLLEVTNKLKEKPPIVLSDEIINLHKELEDVHDGNRFIFMGGDCAETFREHSVSNIIKNYQLFILSTLILMNNSGKKITKIARAAGQFSKPRSSDYENINGLKITSYKGDMINREDVHNRDPDPYLMLDAYQQSVETMNMIRSLSSSYRFSNINIDNWETEFKDDIYKLSTLRKLLRNIKNNINLLKSSGIDNDKNLNNAVLYTGHEGLLLPYEEAFTRLDRFTKKYYDCSAHFLWIGERTRNLNEAHIEFFKGINNPIGIKISDKVDPNELLKLLEILNPDNKKGRICLITRMGNKLKEKLPILIDKITKHKKNVIWICDPMHGNTKTVFSIKTRFVSDIYSELYNFFEIHKKKGTIAGGIHLEMTGNNVTECLGGNYIEMSNYSNFLDKNYLSACDPRLNLFQTIEIIEKVSKLI